MFWISKELQNGVDFTFKNLWKSSWKSRPNSQGHFQRYVLGSCVDIQWYSMPNWCMFDSYILTAAANVWVSFLSLAFAFAALHLKFRSFKSTILLIYAFLSCCYVGRFLYSNLTGFMTTFDYNFAAFDQTLGHCSTKKLYDNFISLDWVQAQAKRHRKVLTVFNRSWRGREHF